MNHDGKISREEARGRLKRDFDKIDLNKDGFIDRDELLKAARERAATPPPKTKKTASRRLKDRPIGKGRNPRKFEAYCLLHPYEKLRNSHDSVRPVTEVQENSMRRLLLDRPPRRHGLGRPGVRPAHSVPAGP